MFVALIAAAVHDVAHPGMMLCHVTVANGILVDIDFTMGCLLLCVYSASILLY